MQFIYAFLIYFPQLLFFLHILYSIFALSLSLSHFDMTLKWSNNHFYDSSPPELEPSVILHSVGQGQGHWKGMGARHVWWAVPGMVEASRDNSSAYNKLTHQQSTHTHAHTHRDTRFTCCLMTATLCSIGQIYCNNRPVLSIVYNLKLLFL